MAGDAPQLWDGFPMKSYTMHLTILAKNSMAAAAATVSASRGGPSTVTCTPQVINRPYRTTRPSNSVGDRFQRVLPHTRATLRWGFTLNGRRQISAINYTAFCMSPLKNIAFHWKSISKLQSVTCRIWDNTMLPATQRRWTRPRLNLSQIGRYKIEYQFFCLFYFLNFMLKVQHKVGKRQLCLEGTRNRSHSTKSYHTA